MANLRINVVGGSEQVRYGWSAKIQGRSQGGAIGAIASPGLGGENTKILREKIKKKMRKILYLDFKVANIR